LYVCPKQYSFLRSQWGWHGSMIYMYLACTSILHTYMKTRCTFKMNCKTKVDSNFRNLQNIRGFSHVQCSFWEKCY
jgi:hypothetical protein